MDEVRADAGFKERSPHFFEYLRTDQRFEPPSREWLRDGYYAIGRRVDAQLSAHIFSTIPRPRWRSARSRRSASERGRRLL